MTLADRIGRALEQHGARNHRQLARLIIAEVRDHDARLLEHIRVRDLPLPECPDGCVVGAEWKRRAEHARGLIDAYAAMEPNSEEALLAAATKEDNRG